MPSQHLFKLSQTTPHEKTAGGWRIKASKHNFPILQGMSLYKLHLNEGGIREPHWHANADELGYCVNGSGLVTLYNTGDVKYTFLVNAGDAFFIPSGALHHIENAGQGETEFILSFSNEDTEDFSLSSLLGQEGFSNSVLGNTWSKSNTYFEGLHRDKGPAFAVVRKGDLSIPESAHHKNPYSYQLEATQPILTNEAGSVHMARQNFWPILKRQALYTLKLTGTGMREPHWHPETAELGYVTKGRGRMSIYNPEGNVDTYVMEEGDIYFIPKAYPHHIENLEKDQPLDILVFFDQGMPGDVGFSGSVRAFSNEVLGDITQTNPAFFEQLPMYYADLFIVNKRNDCTP